MLLQQRNREIENVLKNKLSLIKKRVEKFDEIDNLPFHKLPVVKRPDCESQVVVLLTSLISNDLSRSYIRYIDKIGHYSNHTSTDMICLDKDNNKILVEIEYKLSNLFKHDHSYDTFDYVVCWSVDLEAYEKKKLIDGCCLTLMREDDEWILKYGTQKVIPVIELKEVLAKIEQMMEA